MINFKKNTKSKGKLSFFIKNNFKSLKLFK